jgi:tRNA threonylcarbamoyladenosine biosynthesis protein TsaE
MSSLLMIPRAADVDQLAASLLHTFSDRRVFAFRGELGVGKTTLIKALCRELGVNDDTASPSFSIVNEYHDAHDEPVYHFDLYRLKDVRELESIGLIEYLDSGRYCFVEWPELAMGLLPPGAVTVRMTIVDGERALQIDLSPTRTTSAN